MRTRERQLWLGFIEQAIGCLALIAVAVLRSPSSDFWPSLAMLVVAYVGGIFAATAILDRRLLFARSRPDGEPDVDVSVWLMLAAGAVVFAALLVAFDWNAWPPSVRIFAVVIASTSAGTIGWGIAASGIALPVTRPLGRLRGHVRTSGLGRWFYRGMPPCVTAGKHAAGKAAEPGKRRRPRARRRPIRLAGIRRHTRPRIHVMRPEGIDPFRAGGPPPRVLRRPRSRGLRARAPQP